ncbi:MAG: hypothetical protein HY574_11110 [candidate division NC10 bacterium]|nr:hypothetical protein [candidate division NC10 bacterium]
MDRVPAPEIPWVACLSCAIIPPGQATIAVKAAVRRQLPPSAFALGKSTIIHKKWHRIISRPGTVAPSAGESPE